MGQNSSQPPQIYFSIASDQSTSHFSQSGNQIYWPVSQNKVVFVGFIVRELGNYVQVGLLYHQALLVVTSDTKEDLIIGEINENEEKVSNSNWECHIVEYMNDSKAHAYKIQLQNKPLYCHDIRKFYDGLYNWDAGIIVWDFYLKQFSITVDEIQQMMQRISNSKGEYKVISNNCQQAAWQTQLRLNKYQMFIVEPGLFQAEKTYHEQVAQELVNYKSQTKTFSYCKLREFKNLIKQKKNLSNFQF